MDRRKLLPPRGSRWDPPSSTTSVNTLSEVGFPHLGTPLTGRLYENVFTVPPPAPANVRKCAASRKRRLPGRLDKDLKM